MKLKKLQDRIINSYNELFTEWPLKENIKKSFYDTPRHSYVEKFRYENAKDWIYINSNNLIEHLPIIYRDRYLITDGEDDDHITSSISQPSLVLLMLNLLPIEKGVQVLEIGAGSGWNAAMIGKLVGTDGSIDTIEIDEIVSNRAKKNIKKNKITNVNVITADGANAVPNKKYDIVQFTVGAYDLTPEIFNSIKENGYLMFVLKSFGGGDILYLLKKNGNYLTSLFALPCGFVQMQGKLRLKEAEPIYIYENKNLSNLLSTNPRHAPMWFGGKSKAGFFWRSMALRGYLSITSKKYFVGTFKKGVEINSDEVFFGLYEENKSLITIEKERISSYGNDVLYNEFKNIYKDWALSGMPSLACFDLKIHLNSLKSEPAKEYSIKRKYCTFNYKYNHPKI